MRKHHCQKSSRVSALIRAGKFAVNNTMLSSLENIIEEKVKRYIESIWNAPSGAVKHPLSGILTKTGL
ncbi:MAG: hypothetical protein R2874_12770 [Desulfobacterales bacterium]